MHLVKKYHYKVSGEKACESEFIIVLLGIVWWQMQTSVCKYKFNF